MSKQIFYRSKAVRSCDSLRKIRNTKSSLDDLVPYLTKPSKQMKKSVKRLSNDNFDASKVERSTFKKDKFKCSATASNSILMSKNNSPFKLSPKHSQIHIEQQNKLKRYKFYYQIGFGGFGRVWKVQCKLGSKEYAMKQISKRKVIQKNNIESVLNQRKILSLLNHPFLININRAFQDSEHLYLIMDYLRGGDLRYHICYKQNFTEKQIKFIIACIVVGLEYVHKNNIIHKDLKPENIVFEENGYVRITDFGIAKTKSAETNLLSKSQSSGTPVYMAPQILFKRDYSFQADYYALGVITYELIMGKRPYEGKNRSEIRQQILQKEISLDQRLLPPGWSPHLADFINKLLKTDPRERLGMGGIHQIKQHKYMADLKWKKLEKKQLKPPFIPNVICQTKQFLDQIALFNQMNSENKENGVPIDQSINRKFVEYDYDKKIKEPSNKFKKTNNLKKIRRISQKKISHF